MERRKPERIIIMKKYYCEIKPAPAGITASDYVCVIHEYDTANGMRRYRNGIFIYNSAFRVSELFDTVEAAIKSLNGSRRLTVLPDGSTIIPEEVNYPDPFKGILETWNPNIREFLPGQY